MPRIPALSPEQAPAESRALLEAVQAKLGRIPNITRTLAHSPAVLGAYLKFSAALTGGSLSASERETVALAVAQANGCGYCLSAHSMMGKNAGLTTEAMASARSGEGSAIAAFARQVTLTRAQLNDSDVAQARASGLGDAQIVEILALVAMNTLTNYVNHVALTEIDFPVVTV